MPTPQPTEMELISTLRRTNLPTLLVEGKDDEKIFRWLEDQFGVGEVDIILCGGREMLLSIFKERYEFKSAKIAWLADRDMWRFTEIPPEYAEVIFTEGYSIENDLYAGSEIERYLDQTERNHYSELIRVISRWMAYEIEEYLADREYQIATHNFKSVVDFDLKPISIREGFALSRGYVEAPESRITALIKDWRLAKIAFV